MDIIDERNIRIQSLNKNWYHNKVAALDMLRLDLIHPVISGNKWYKLKHNLRYAQANNYKSVLTFGGAYSNHLIATAAAAKQKDIHSIGIVRGNYLSVDSSETLQHCHELGMQLKFISKEEYKKKSEIAWLEKISKEFNNPFIIAEGGANSFGRKGAEEIGLLVPEEYSHVCVSAGTATTFIGLRNVLSSLQTILVLAPMKKGKYLESEIIKYLVSEKNNNWKLFDQWHFGGFGKSNMELINFTNSFYKQNKIPLDIVYTSKMMYGIYELLQQDFFSAQAKILCIHTGGLQGNKSVKGKLSQPD